MTVRDVKDKLTSAQNKRLSDIARELGWSRQVLNARLRALAKPAMREQWLVELSMATGVPAHELAELARK